jgi:hypothetical protein
MEASEMAPQTMRCVDEYVDDTDIFHPLGERQLANAKPVKAAPERWTPAAPLPGERFVMFVPAKRNGRVYAGILSAAELPADLMIYAHDETLTEPEIVSHKLALYYNRPDQIARRRDARTEQAREEQERRQRQLAEADELEAQAAALRAS